MRSLPTLIFLLSLGFPVLTIAQSEWGYNPDSPIPITELRLNDKTIASYRDATTAIKLHRARNSGYTLSATLTTLGRKQTDGSRDLEIEIQYRKPDTA